MKIPDTFRSLSADLPVKIYTRNLPHWRQDGASYFVTFRLFDSVPESVLRDQRLETKLLYRELGVEDDGKLPGDYPASAKLLALQQRQLREIENVLDEGRGAVVFYKSPAREPLVEAFEYHSGSTCEVYAYVIMLNACPCVDAPAAEEAA